MTDQELVALIETATDEELDKIIAQLHLNDDFPSYCSNVLKVQTPQSKIVPYQFYQSQRILHEMIEKYIAPKRLIRVVALKARRMGFSTYFSARFYRATSCNHNKYAIQITHEPDATDFLFKMVKRFHNLSPPGLKPETLYNNARLLEFNTSLGMGLNSAFRVATAGKDDVGSGQLTHYLHFSEAAKYPAHNIKDLLTSIFPCVPDDPGTEIVFESTAKGMGGEFYDRFWSSRYHLSVPRLEDGKPVIEERVNENAPEDNIFTSIFLPWFCHDIYRITPQPGFLLTKDEKEIMERYGLDEGQMAWRRWVIANKCDNNLDTFNQEYPDNPRSAFLGSGRPIFKDVTRLMAMAEAAPKPVARYEYLSNNFVTNPQGRLRVWEEPKTGEAYIISADVAEGLVSGDFSCADVINHRTGKQVAQWHGNLDADNIFEFGDILAALGQRYNTALLGVERNNHGMSVVTQLYNLRYPRIYSEMVPDPPGRPRKRYGWLTSRATKPLIIDNLIREFHEGSDGIVCKETFEEMLSFKLQDNGKMEADNGCYDDRVMSYAIGKHLRQVVDLPSMAFSHNGRFGKSAASMRPPSALGWT